MKNLEADLKSGNLKKAYLFFGEETYLIRQYKHKMIQALLPESDTMNLTVFEGNNTDPKEIIAQADTMPFFAEHRLIIIEESGFFKKTSEPMADYMEHIPDTSCLLFIESAVDKRSRMYKRLNKFGRSVEFKRQKEDILMKWILVRLKKDHRKITRRVMEEFLSKTGNDMEVISQELEKVLCYSMGREEITSADVEAVCTDQISGRIFEMIDAIGAGNQKKALDRYYELLVLREAPMRILYLITRQFHILMRLKSMQQNGLGAQLEAEKLKIPRFAIRKNTAQANRFSLKQLEAAFKSCVSADENIKSGKISDRLAVEMLIIENSRL